MKIRTNQNLDLGSPVGSKGEFDELKNNYSDLKIKSIDYESKECLKLDVQYGNNELHLYLRAKNNIGENDLVLLEARKSELIGKEVNEAINIEL